MYNYFGYIREYYKYNEINTVNYKHFELLIVVTKLDLKIRGIH